jgi:hypothetical protein
MLWWAGDGDVISCDGDGKKKVQRTSDNYGWKKTKVEFQVMASDETKKGGRQMADGWEMKWLMNERGIMILDGKFIQYGMESWRLFRKREEIVNMLIISKLFCKIGVLYTIRNDLICLVGKKRNGRTWIRIQEENVMKRNFQKRGRMNF